MSLPGRYTVVAVVLTPTRLLINDRLLTLNNLNPDIHPHTANPRPLLVPCHNLVRLTVLIHRPRKRNRMALLKCNRRRMARPNRNRHIPRNTVNNRLILHPPINPRIQPLLKPHKEVLEVLPVVHPAVLPAALLAGE